MKKLLSLFLIVGISLAISLPLLVSAQTTGTITPTTSPVLDRLNAVGSRAGYSSSTGPSTLLEILGTGISVGLSLLGVIFIILILLAGYNWMTAAGDEEKITKASKTIRAAIIGLLIIVAAFAIWMFISNIIIGGGGGGTSFGSSGD